MPDLTARSVVLSVLLGAHPAHARAGELVRLTSDFGIKESTLRVALTRMVNAGDLIRSADGYRLSDRLLARQRRQDDAIDPKVRPWRGQWVTLIVTSVGDDARTRAALRNAMHDKRFGELREGVWMRPDNIDTQLGPDVTDRARVITARDDDPADLAGRLWDLPDWARAGHRLLDEMAAAPDVPGRFVVAAAMVRHLLTDPVLPDELLPPDWPGTRLRAAYHDFAAELMARRDPLFAEAT
ncbi:MULTISPECIES: PaaX family transcriptional regulator C-terminal domain-containing protein [Mycobacterium avium complex (MAC)]|uniref:PaaX domain-containing protein, C-domain protein n=1 Tax=Mycobacterium avium subsp. hominissuis TaxID=439334 RepID=A0AAI8X4P3_MYCAV|nr:MULTISPECIES: PaaX family transcriptional regulator C-terminal domain-containing protein [Mycobacterium avium complex (MAC)]ETB47639.1 PaaX domain-containing protein, C- domain [Mycobacterium avium 10-5560]ETZ64645.1 paaX-like family protein [Mycobacterium sp. MAC_080597_8934]ETZ76022.1 paaX-like family protein [Mycobacterium sp. MAC_011194_8550]MBZ4574369.1 PaaX domain-containing protein, C- domain protein [Mycobacterium avium subsp. hominissuis]PBA09454.1 PaaX domain-containing protein, C